MNSPVAKKILFVITKSNWGGAQRYVYELATHFKSTGANVAVAFGGTGEASASEGLLAERLAEAGVRTIFLKSFTRDMSLVRDIRAFSELRNIIRAGKPDILHLNSSKAGGIGGFAGRIARVPRIIFTAHGWPHREARNGVVRTLIWIASWITILLSHRVIAVSQCDRREAPVIFSRRKIVSIYNGIDSNKPLLKKERARSTLYDLAPHLEIAVPRIVCIGELTRNKAYDLLLPAFTRVTTPFSCIIMGDGEEHAKIRERIQALQLDSKVACVGFVAEASMLLSGADMLVLPSRKEGFPFVLLEAGHASLAVVATDTGGIRELIIDGVTGTLVPPGNVDALACAIEQQLKEESLRITLGKNLHERVVQEFSEKQMIEKTFACYLST